MAGERIWLYDTTLRDGAQTQGVDFSVADKRSIAEELDRIGIDYIEGGWPGANPTDDALFADPPLLRQAVFTAFGMTRRSGRSAANDPNLAALFQSGARAVCLFGKTWDFQVDVALEIPREENLRLIHDSVAAALQAKGEALFDAEHFFDGYKANPGYALACLEAAHSAGARWITLCDTNGGTLPDEIERIVTEVARTIPAERLGIHCHDDTGNGVANSLAAVRAGARMVQGTLNGLGERCGNANLVSLIPTLMLKMGFSTGIGEDHLHHLTQLSRSLDERLNRTPDRHAPYVGASAFAHKGGVHASAVMKNPACYEHIAPEIVGNQRQIVISDQAGRANMAATLRAFGLEVDPADPRLNDLVALVKQRDLEGYAYDTAEASFELLARRRFDRVPRYFELLRVTVTDDRRYNALHKLITESVATVKLMVGQTEMHTVAEGNGPVNAMDHALRKALEPVYPVLREVRLVDFKVRILRASDGSGAMPRVLIRSVNGDGLEWSTLGVSTNIIDASIEALLDAFIYKLLSSGAGPG
jgi:2-isopropylmalate synthase